MDPHTSKDPHTPTGPQQGSVHDETPNSQPQLQGEENQKEQNEGQLQHGMLFGNQVHQGNDPVGNFHFNPNFLQNQGYGFMPQIPMGVGMHSNYLQQGFNFLQPPDLFNQPMQSYTPFEFMQSLSRIPQQQRVLSWDNMSAQRQEAELALRLRSPIGHPSQYMRMDNFVPVPFNPPHPSPFPYPNAPAMMNLSNYGQIYSPEQQNHGYYNNIPTTATSPLVHSPSIPTPTYGHGNVPFLGFTPPPMLISEGHRDDSIPKAPGAMILPQSLISRPNKSQSPSHHTSLYEMPTAGYNEDSSPSKMSDISLSIPSANPTPSKAPPTLQRLANRKEMSREENDILCLGCGKVGHHMNDCLAECGHCGMEGHKTIYCKYRSLEGEQLALQVALTKSKKKKMRTEKKTKENEMRCEREAEKIRAMKDIKQERRSLSPEQERQYQTRSMMADDSPRVNKEERNNGSYSSKQPYKSREERQFGYGMRENSPIRERQSRYRERDYSPLRERRGVRGSWGEVLEAPRDARTPVPVSSRDSGRREGLVLDKNGKWMRGDKPYEAEWTSRDKRTGNGD